MALRDYKWIFKTHMLVLKDSKNLFWDYYIFDFEIGNLTWETWEHAFFIAQEKLEKDRWWRALSIASNHKEWIMRVATRISNTPSNFKKYLKNMKTWDKMKIRGPFGTFKIQDKTSPIVMIAWGIGIAPMRALLDRVKNETHQDIVLLYSSRDWYAFQEEFNEIAKNNIRIKLHYISWRDELNIYIQQYSNQYKNSWYYYLSWTPNMIKWVTKTLKDNNIKNNRLLNDPFYGY